MILMGNYKVVKQAINYELANFLFNYFLLKREAVAHMYDTNMTYDSGLLGTWKDDQIPNTYSIYGDPAFDTLLMKVLPIMKRETGLEVVPTYSYARLYKHGDELKKHKDRPSCEISTTINLGGESWSIFLEGTEILLNIGDMLIYEGCKLEHWREPFEGENCGQVFLHYNNVNGPNSDINIFDGREKLGLPAWRKKNKS
jgi:hypothetical protein